jgi:hypothetical protein
VRLEREIRQSRDRERAAADAALARPGVNAAQAVEAAGDARFRAEVAAIEDLAIRAAAAAGPGDQGQVRQIEAQRQRQLAEAEARREEFVRTGVGRVQGAGGARAQAAEAGRIIDEAQQEIADSITTGIAGFFDGANQERRAQLARLERDRAQLEKDIFRAATNEVAIEATKTAIEASAAIGGALQILTDSIGDPRTSIIGERLEAITQSILEAEERIRTAQEAGDVDAAEAAKAQIDAANEQKDALISGARSVAAFAAVLDRVSNDLANTVAQEARSAADQARRDANAAQAKARFGGPRQAEEVEFSIRRRNRLEEQARAADDNRRAVERANSLARQEFEADAANGILGDRAQELIRNRDEAQAVLDDQKSTADQRAAATRSRDDANAQLDRIFEDSPAGRAAKSQANFIDIEAQEAAQRDADILRGRELRETPAAQAGRELADSLRQLETSFDQDVADDVLNRQDADAQLAAARRQQIDQAFRSQAPAIAGLADSVANALLQGPSRAALNATDVSTVEGARELNRLIRGDDAARDQNLEELRRQSGQLQELIQAVRDNGGDIAN